MDRWMDSWRRKSGRMGSVIAMDVEDDDYNGYSWVDPSGFYLPGTPAPMCYCGDPCKMRVSGLYKTYWQRYWCCANEDGDRSVDALGLPHRFVTSRSGSTLSVQSWLRR
ncbi:hypothetical protein EJB05_40685, partial [Eragrostis curvula]